jgi:hypothetical protein
MSAKISGMPAMLPKGDLATYVTHNQFAVAAIIS